MPTLCGESSRFTDCKELRKEIYKKKDLIRFTQSVTRFLRKFGTPIMSIAFYIRNALRLTVNLPKILNIPCVCGGGDKFFLRLLFRLKIAASVV